MVDLFLPAHGHLYRWVGHRRCGTLSCTATHCTVSYDSSASCSSTRNVATARGPDGWGTPAPSTVAAGIVAGSSPKTECNLRRRHSVADTGGWCACAGTLGSALVLLLLLPPPSLWPTRDLHALSPGGGRCPQQWRGRPRSTP